MNPEIVGAWLKRKNTAARGWNLAGGVGLLLAGLLAIYIIFWVSYAVLWFVTQPFFPLGHGVRLLLSAGFVVLVVVVGAKQNWEEIDPLEQQARLARDMGIALDARNPYGVSLTTNAANLAEFEARSLVTVCNAILCGAAKLLIGGVRTLRRSWRLRDFDAEGCGRVLALLAAQGKRQAFTEIVEKLPGLNPVKVFDDLRHVEGVLFLANEPPGLTLHPDLRTEVTRLARLN